MRKFDLKCRAIGFWSQSAKLASAKLPVGIKVAEYAARLRIPPKLDAVGAIQ